MDLKEKKIELLVKQCELSDHKILSYQNVGSKVLGYGSTLILTILAIALKEKITAILLILPAAMFILIFYWMNVDAWVLSEGGYKKAMEEKINKMLDENIYLWESKIVTSKHINLNNIILDIIYFLVLLACIIASVNASFELKVHWITGIIICANAILCFLALLCLIRNKTEFKNTYEEAKKHFKD